jgi:hypothetical protein
LPRALPKARAAPPVAPDAPLPVLLLTNYLPRAWGYDASWAEHYQRPFFRAVQALAQEAHVTLRWRPHPADDPDRVRELLAEWPALKRSPHRDLTDDLEWSALVVSSYSSAAIEAALYDRPVLVHEVPRWDPSSFDAFSEERRFTTPTELVERTRPLVPLVRAADPRRLDAEQALRERLFGPTGVPLGARSLLDGESEQHPLRHRPSGV